MGMRDVPPHRVALEAMDPPLALLQVHRVRRQVPVHDGMAVGMEVEPLLPHRGGGQDERPERRVESLAHPVDSLNRLAVLHPVTQPQAEARSKPNGLYASRVRLPRM